MRLQDMTGVELVIAAEDLVRALPVEDDADALRVRRLEDLPLTEDAARLGTGVS